MSDGDSTELSSPATTPSTSQDAGYTASASSVNQREEEVEFDLSNPMDLETKMNNLTDEEIDELLKQALKVNKELKKELRGAPEKSRSAAPKTLPPLRNTSGHGSRNYSSTSSRSSSNTHNPPSRKKKEKLIPGGPGHESKTANTSTRRGPPKPEWNDRFGL